MILRVFCCHVDWLGDKLLGVRAGSEVDEQPEGQCREDVVERGMVHDIPLRQRVDAEHLRSAGVSRQLSMAVVCLTRAANGQQLDGSFGRELPPDAS